MFGIICVAYRRVGEEAIIFCMYRGMLKVAAMHPEILLPDELQQQGRMCDGSLCNTPGTRDTPTGVSLTAQAPEGASQGSSARVR